MLNGKQFLIEKNRMFLPCPFQNCFFCGDKLFRHLQSRHHKMSKEKSALFHSYLIRYVDYYSLICKSPKHSPQICIKCNRFYLRIDSHIEYTHQLKRNSNEFKHAISKRHRHTQQFGLNYLAEIQKTELVQNEPVLTQELENINVKSKKIISTIKSTSTITHPTSNKPSTSSSPSTSTTIKSKPTNFNRFLTFLELRSIYIDETFI